MNNFEKSVPFDPGYSQYSFSFLEQIAYITREYSQLKSAHQKKFKLGMIEPAIIDVIKKCTAFYLGCMLWGGYIHYRFLNDPKEITGNNTKDLTEEEIKILDFTEESKLIIKYIEQFDRDCKYFLKKPAKIEPLILEILNSYIKFVEINNNFIGLENTKNIKVPKDIEHFKTLSIEQLDDLYNIISEVVESGKIEKLLQTGFYKI
jgi:hypothetical protein